MDQPGAPAPTPSDRIPASGLEGSSVAITQDPRRITTVSAARETRVSSVAVPPVGTPGTISSAPIDRFEASRPEDVEALVMPGQATTTTARNGSRASPTTSPRTSAAQRAAARQGGLDAARATVVESSR